MCVYLCIICVMIYVILYIQISYPGELSDTRYLRFRIAVPARHLSVNVQVSQIKIFGVRRVFLQHLQEAQEVRSSLNQ